MGTMKVQEYTNHFQELMRYALEDSDTEKKKMYWYRKGLHRVMAHHLSAHDCLTLHELIGKALRVEKSRLKYVEVRGDKRKRSDQPGRPGPPQRQRTGSPPYQSSRPRHYSSQTQQVRSNPGGSGGSGTWRLRQQQPVTAEGARVTCYSCRQPGHKSFECP